MKTWTWTWTIKFEAMDGTVKTAKYKGETYHEAIKALCEDVRVGNILKVTDSDKGVWLS